MLRVTKTENGMVRGITGTDARITVFKGIPFADDTSGKNRWRPPQPAKDWEGIRECYEFGPISMQRTPGKDPTAFYAKEWHVDPDVKMGEDCLTANIWTPAKSTDEKLPVMVWIFGGGLQEGYPYEMEFDGERIASRGVILVSIGYRLNVFGLLAHPEITAENPDGPANFAFQDQVYGIEWVKRNIANFGGDPENITIFGQSAGAFSVVALMCSPKTKGLFQKAIIESIGGMRPIYPIVWSMTQVPLEEREKTGVEFFEKLGVKTLEEARALPAEYIRDKFGETRNFWGAVTDGVFLEKSMEDYIVNNEMNDVKFIIGNTKDEFLVAPKGDDEQTIDEFITKEFGPYADGFREAVKKTDLPLKEAVTIHQMGIGNRIMAAVCAKQNLNFWYYTFGASIPGDNAGCFHSCDLWFQFETLMKCWRPFDGHHYDIARKICNYWTNFAKYGDPNGKDKDGTDLPLWEKYTEEKPYGIKFYDTIEMETEPLNPAEQYMVDINLKEFNVE
ncbi:MAG: carboxylesterase family protein [Lachnospiraceae bacterium]|nr:carboxylesterase family protein [Lachnospiraceae bacterium]